MSDELSSGASSTTMPLPSKKWYIVLVAAIIVGLMCVGGVLNYILENTIDKKNKPHPTAPTPVASVATPSQILPSSSSTAPAIIRRITGTATCKNGEPVSGVWIEVQRYPSEPYSGFAGFELRNATTVKFSFTAPRYYNYLTHETYRVNVGCGRQISNPNEWVTDNKGPWVQGVTHQQLTCDSSRLRCHAAQ